MSVLQHNEGQVRVVIRAISSEGEQEPLEEAVFRSSDRIRVVADHVRAALRLSRVAEVDIFLGGGHPLEDETTLDDNDIQDGARRVIACFCAKSVRCIHLTRLPVRSLSAKYRSGDQVLEAIRDRYSDAKTQNDFGLLGKLQKQITETEAIMNEENAAQQELQRVTAEANERFKAAREQIVKRRDEANARAHSAPQGQADSDLGDSIQAELDWFPTTLKAFHSSEALSPQFSEFPHPDPNPNPNPDPHPNPASLS